MLKEFVEKIISLDRLETLTISGTDGIKRVYTARTMTPVHEPQDAVEQVCTLAGFVDLISAEVNRFPRDGCYVKIENPWRVWLSNRKCDAWGRRQHHIVAQAPKLGFISIAQFLPREDFLVAVHSMFPLASDREQALSVSENLTTCTSGAMPKSEIMMQLVRLAPSRTFREVGTIGSEFLLQVRLEQGGAHGYRLVEVGSVAWELDVMRAIRDWLESKSLGLPIVS